MSVEETQQYFYSFCKNNGMSDNAIFGVMGNISNECDWDYDQQEVGGGGYGLIQWTGTRRTQLENYGTDLEHQCNFFYAELTGSGDYGSEAQWINAHGYTYSKFMAGEYSPSESALAFMYCFERPNLSVADIEKRTREAERFAGMEWTGQGGTGQDGTGQKVENAVKWMIDIAEDDSHGYDQDYRWGEHGDYDCSSLVISGYTQAGIDLKGNGATYTGNMKEVCLSLGFKEIEVNDWNDTSQFKRGDIILNEQHHVCCYIGNGQIVQASINENGEVRGGESGDQTGKEILVKDYYIYSHGWDCVLRLGNGASSGGSGGESKEEVWKAINETCYNIKQLTEEEIAEIKKLDFNSKCKIRYTFNRNKKQVGTNFWGKKLTINEKEYIINNVRNDGFVILSQGGSGYYNYINPKYLISVENKSEEGDDENVE